MEEKIKKTLYALSVLLGISGTLFVIYLVLGNRSTLIIFSACSIIIAILIQIFAHLQRWKRLHKESE